MADASKTVSIIFEGDTTSAEASVGRLNVALGNVLEAEKKLNAESATGIDKIEQESQQAAQKVDGLNQELEKTGDKAPTIDKATQALKILATSLVIKDWIDANQAAEQFRATMVAVTGDSEKAGVEFEYVREAANRLGLDVRGAGESYARLAAATKGTALEGDGARVIFEAVAGSLSLLGSKTSDVDAALVQVAQGISKGKFELEDLKSIAERMPGFFDAFARSLNVTTPALFDLISQGKIGAKEFLVFANTLNDSLGTAQFDTYTANMNRLRNAIDEAYVVIGDAGAWDVFNGAIKFATVTITGAVAFVKLLGETLANIAFTIASGDWSGFGTRFDESVAKIAPAIERANSALLNVSENTKAAGFNASEAGKDIAAGMNAAADAAEAFSLKAFDKIVKTTTSAEDLASATAGLAIAYAKGEITAGDYYSRLDDVQRKQLELDKAMGGATTRMLEQEKQLSRNKKETEEAKNETEKFRLEMEKIASNERIKLIEAKIKLDIAEVEANAKVAVAAFGSIDSTVKNTGETLVKLFDILAGGTKDWESWRRLTSEIEKESARRDEALSAQNKLIEAQVDLMRARATAIERGNPIITVDGAGLQPHLEAFMWEILRTIQVRVNQDGLEMLVGV